MTEEVLCFIETDFSQGFPGYHVGLSYLYSQDQTYYTKVMNVFKNIIVIIIIIIIKYDLERSL